MNEIVDAFLKQYAPDPDGQQLGRQIKRRHQLMRGCYLLMLLVGVLLVSRFGFWGIIAGVLLLAAGAVLLRLEQDRSMALLQDCLLQQCDPAMAATAFITCQKAFWKGAHTAGCIDLARNLHLMGARELAEQVLELVQNGPFSSQNYLNFCTVQAHIATDDGDADTVRAVLDTLNRWKSEKDKKVDAQKKEQIHRLRRTLTFLKGKYDTYIAQMRGQKQRTPYGQVCAGYYVGRAYLEMGDLTAAGEQFACVTELSGKMELALICQKLLQEARRQDESGESADGREQ